MTTEADLLRAVVDDPEDVSARLILADWWDERGDIRGELVRVQMLVASLLKEPAAPLRDFRLVRAANRERELLREPGRSPPELGPGIQIETDRRVIHTGAARYPRVVFCRGFIEELSLPLAAWLEHGPWLVRAAPLRRVTLSDREPTHPEGGAPHWWEWRWIWRHYNLAIPDAPGYCLPDCLAPRLGSGERTHLPLWAGRDDALSFLSAACLKWARAEAARLGLP